MVQRALHKSGTELKASSPLRNLGHALVAGAALIGLGGLATFPLAWEDQAIVGGALFLLAWLLHRSSNSRTATLTLVAVSIFTTVRYLWWRFAETFSYLSYNAGLEAWSDLIFVGLLLGAETYAFTILVLGYFQSSFPFERKPVPLPDDVNEWPTVDVLIPTYNEPLSVLKPTVLAALNMDWPRDKMRVLVLDDGRRDEIREFAERAGAEYIARPDNRFAKAGNLNNTLRQTDGDLVAIFDCDHIPTRSFLQMTAGAFLHDEKMALLQTPHHFYTPNPIERNLDVFQAVPDEGVLFYGVIQKGNDFWNATSFAGSCAVLRRTALEEIGGIAVETVTEDAHTSLRLQKNGWNTGYISIPQAAGLAAFTLRDHINQRIRWARGLVQILRLENPLGSRELTWPQRLCYFNSSIHFLYAIPRLVFLTAPLGFLLLDLSNFYGYILAILAYALPHLFLATMTNSRLQGRHRNPYWNEIYETILAPFIIIPTLVALINPRTGSFNVTPKKISLGAKRFDWLLASPFLLIAALNVTGIALGVSKLMTGQGEMGTLLINIVWATYSTLILGVVLAVAEEQKEVRRESRIPVSLPVFAVSATGQRLKCKTRDVSYGGAAFESPDAAALTQGGQTVIVFDVFGQELKIPARVIRVDKWSAQVRFAPLTLAQEEGLTRVIFTRADAWVSWNDHYPDRFGLWKSISQLAGFSITGYWRVIRALFRRAPRQKPVPMTKASAPAGQAVVSSLVLALAAGLLAATPTRAQVSAPFEEVHDFSEFGLKQPIVLQGVAAEQGFRFWSPLTKVVGAASLDLQFQASPDSPADASLLVLLNSAEVAALPLARPADGQAVNATHIELPADLFVGDNELLFVLDRDCAPSCPEESGAGRAWARIERSSKIQLSGTKLPVALELRMLPMPLLDLSVHRAPEITIVTSAAAEPGELEAAGIAASWLGELSNHRGVRLSARVDDLPQGHAIVAARTGSALAARLGLGNRSKPTISMVENPADPYGTILALVGRDSADVRLAAQALALGQFERSGALAEVAEVSLPAPSEPNAAPRWIDPAEPIFFTSFADEKDLHVAANSLLDLYIRTPADLDYGSKRRLPLTLRYLVRDLPPAASATVTLMMNGVFIGAREYSGGELDDDSYREDVFPVPVESLYPNSTLQISFRVNESQEELAHAYPTLEIRPDSEIDLSGFRHFAAMPRLELFANNGFPFTRRADLAETAVVLGDPSDAASLAAYFNLMGIFGANTGSSALRVTVTPAEQVRGVAQKDILAIGKIGSPVFSPWASQMTIPLDRPDLAVNRDSTVSEWLRFLSWGGFGSERRELARAIRSADEIGAVLQGVETSSGGRAVVAIALPSEAASEELADAMRDSGTVGEIYGAVSFLSKGEPHSFRTAPATFFVGTPSLRATLDFWLLRFLWALPLLAIGLAYGLARVIRTRIDEALALRMEATR